MRPKKQKMIVLGGLLVSTVWIAVHYLSAPDPLPAPLRILSDLNKTKTGQQRSTDGMQWMGVIPPSAVDKQEDVRSSAEVISALTATRRPADALKAYEIIQACEALRPLFELSPMPSGLLPQHKQCATITDTTRRSRYDYLRMAAYGGAPGVGSDWLRYGPSGYPEALRTRPDDPSIIEWKRQARALVIRDGDQGDFNALQDLVNGYAGKTVVFDADPSRELAYAIAYKNVVDQLQLGVTVPNQPTDAELAALAAKLSPNQAAWAKAKALEILAARARRIR